MIITQLVGKFLNLLYEPLAFLYGLVSWTVSFGQWQNWIFTITPFLEGSSILEIGFGPGYLLKHLQNSSYRVVGVDVSRQMVRMALNRLRPAQKSNRDDFSNHTIIRASAMQIPLPSRCMDTIVATFPAPYIFYPRTLLEIRRVLKPSGRLLILLSVQPRRGSLPGVVLSWLYRLTGESSANPEQLEAFLYDRFRAINLSPSIQRISASYADLILIKV